MASLDRLTNLKQEIEKFHSLLSNRIDSYIKINPMTKREKDSNTCKMRDLLENYAILHVML